MKSWIGFSILASTTTLFFLLVAILQNSAYQYQETLLYPLRSVPKADCECGKLTRKLDLERIGKAKVPDGRLPWIAELIMPGDEYKEGHTDVGDDEYLKCYGSLINAKTVVMPASCFDKYSRGKYRVKLHGILNKKESIVDATSILMYPGYRGKYDNDIALLKLKKEINFNMTKISPICLPKVKVKYPMLHPNPKDIIVPSTNESGSFQRVPLELEEEENMVKEEELNEDNSRKPCRNPYPPCVSRPCTCPNNAAVMKKPYILDNYIIRSWFYRKAPGYDFLQRFGCFQIHYMNDSMCYSVFPEMLQSKSVCFKQKEIKEILKQKGDFFMKMELGMPLMYYNTTLVKGKPQPATTKFYLEGMRAPGRNGKPLLESRRNITSVLKIEDYVPWIIQNTYEGHFCKT